VLILESACEVSVAGSWAYDFLGAFPGRRIPGVHGAFPVLEVAIPYCQKNRATQGDAASNSGKHVDLVFFDALASAASVSFLSFRQPEIDIVGSDMKAGRETVQKTENASPVGFACRIVPKHDVVPSPQFALQRRLRD